MPKLTKEEIDEVSEALFPSKEKEYKEENKINLTYIG